MEAQKQVPEQAEQVPEQVPEFKAPLLPCDRITEEEFDFYEEKKKQLRATLTDEEYLSAFGTARSHFNFFEQNEFPFYQRNGHLTTPMTMDGNSIQIGFKIMAGQHHKMDPRAVMYIAMIKDRLIKQLAHGSDGYNKEFLNFFMWANPTWFKAGGKFTEITKKFL